MQIIVHQLTISNDSGIYELNLQTHIVHFNVGGIKS